MKRQIICMKCIKKHPSLFLGNGGVDQKGVDEYINNVKGIALYDFMCDHCGKPINKGDNLARRELYGKILELSEIST